ncbi:carbohydrate ABC transporter permease [Segeticoccus rhizosphaerae]|uniref:carbohydrate ABC transporter permease n=1 Tax=Segeticoccus rhizosphaerae TaxID=1104777 RepID=UPI0013967951|nr:sugar ABC transporter permease [Segeticoccus rhizosphaerae]
MAVRASFTNESLTQVQPASFVGGENYADQVFTSSFFHALWVTVAIIVLSLIVQIPLGLAVATALARPFRGRSVLRSAITVPMMLTPIAVGLMWRFLADPDLGVIRWAASLVQHNAHPNLFGSETGALALLIVVNAWINVPFVTLLLAAALIGVPEEIREAAAIDGAGASKTFWYVLLPMIAPVIAVVALLRGAADYRMFDLIYVVTQGGPGDATRNLSLLAYQQGLISFQVGRASAIAIAMAVVAAPAYLLYTRVIKP